MNLAESIRRHPWMPMVIGFGAGLLVTHRAMKCSGVAAMALVTKVAMASGKTWAYTLALKMVEDHDKPPAGASPGAGLGPGMGGR